VIQKSEEISILHEVIQRGGAIIGGLSVFHGSISLRGWLSEQRGTLGFPRGYFIVGGGPVLMEEMISEQRHFSLRSTALFSPNDG